MRDKANTVPTFVPWTDRALLAQESTYSVLNKVAWFLAIPPTAFVRRCRHGFEGRQCSSPRWIRFDPTHSWLHYLENELLMPRVMGLTLPRYIASVEKRMIDEVPERWCSSHLRVCRECIAGGVHLRLHQHLAIERCPVHATVLVTACFSCGKLLEWAMRDAQCSFSCCQCNSIFLHDGDIAIDHSSSFRYSTCVTTDTFLLWQRDVNLRTSAGCGITITTLAESHPLRAIDSNSLLLEAACRVSPAPPCVRQRRLYLAEVRYRKIRVDTAMGDATSRRLSSDPIIADCVALNGRRSKSRFYSLQTIDAERKLQALRRVTAVFLSCYRKRHDQCLDEPYRMFGEELREDEEHPQELLQCCPVAVGFWLWRISSAKIHMRGRVYQDSHNGGLVGNLDLLLYAVAKSHLHYCIYTAHSCSVYHQNSVIDVAGAIAPLRSLFDSHSSSWAPESSTQDYTRIIGLNGVSYHIGFDAREMLSSIACPGGGAYASRLRRKYGRVPFMMVNSLENTWAEWQPKQVVPFAPMSRDAIFSAPKELMHLRRVAGLSHRGWTRDFVFSLGLKSDVEVSVLDIAINSRIPTRSVPISTNPQPAS